MSSPESHAVHPSTWRALSLFTGGINGWGSNGEKYGQDVVADGNLSMHALALTHWPSRIFPLQCSHNETDLVTAEDYSRRFRESMDAYVAERASRSNADVVVAPSSQWLGDIKGIGQ